METLKTLFTILNVNVTGITVNQKKLILIIRISKHGKTKHAIRLSR